MMPVPTYPEGRASCHLAVAQLRTALGLAGCHLHLTLCTSEISLYSASCGLRGGYIRPHLKDNLQEDLCCAGF